MPKTDLRISNSEITKMISPLGNFEDPVEAFAAAAISHLTEPADQFAGAVASYLGYKKLLSAVLGNWQSSDIASQIEQGIEEIETKFNSKLDKLWADSLERWGHRVSSNAVKGQLALMAQNNGKLIDQASDFYGSGLYDLGWAKPHVLWLLGNSDVLNFERSLAIVGSRIATNYGAQVTFDVVSTCQENEITSVSGGAFGIDAIAHRASLEMGVNTIAILAGGLDSLYPRNNGPLFDEILKQNAIIAEVPPGVMPAKWRFLQRNRLIAALGQATVVIEASTRSGTISTARHAIDLNRAVGVVPAGIYQAASAGCLRLAREFPGDVQVLARPDDVLELIGLSTTFAQDTTPLGTLETRALDAFSNRPISSQDVQRIAGLTVTETMMALGNLEISGLIKRFESGFRKVRPTLEA